MSTTTSTSTKRPPLTILDGGRTLPLSKMHRILLDAYVTDTRLMGVLAVGAHWNIASPTANRNNPESWEELYQFFYIDCEEAGLETCQQVRGIDIDTDAARLEEALICGLGARKIELDEPHLRLLLQNWAQFNEVHDLPLPAGRERYDFLLSPRIEADEAMQRDLMRMLCPPIRTDEQVVNYFLMRCVGQDREGALYLTDGFEPDLCNGYSCATFCRNVLDVREEHSDGSVTYRCESLIEMNGSYEMVVSLVTVRNLRVTGFERCSKLPITSTEAALILKKTEYITLYEVFLSEDELEENIDEFTLGFHTIMSEHENGRLFMNFRKTNDHVNRREFLLSNDVRGMYFLTNGGQLLLCAYTLEDVRYLERTIARSPLAPYLVKSGRYNFVPGHGRTALGTLEFREPIMYEFISSDYEHFEDFLRALRGE